MAVRTLDLFCGGGGSSYGARAAGAKIICGVDAWHVATKAYARNFPDAQALHLTLTEDTGPEALGDIGRIDLLLASPECTNHTCARGNRPLVEESKRTARYVLNFASALSPRWVVIENVVHMRGWNGYAPLLTALQELGYRLRIEVLDAARFGVPQTRRRLFILGDRLADPGRVPLHRGRTPSVAGILAPPGTWPSTPLYAPRRAQATIERAKRAIAELGTGVSFLIVYYGSDGSGGWQRLSRPLRTITTLDRFGLVTWEGRVPMLRMLQVPELMRAMGYGGDYALDDVRQRRERIKLLGNGVAAPVMTAIVRTLIGAARVSRPSEQTRAARRASFVQAPLTELADV